MISLALAIYLAACPVRAFEYYESPPASLFPFPLAAVDATLPDGISNPAYLPLSPYPSLSSSGSVPHTLADLRSTVLRAGYGARGFGARVSWCRFGLDDQYLEDTVEGGIGYMPIRHISFGASALYRRLSIDTAESSLACHLGDAMLGIRVSPVEWITAAFQLENVVSLFRKKQRDILFPGWAAGATLTPFRGFSLHYNLKKNAIGYVNCISASAAVLKYFCINVGYARELMTSSAALTFIYRYIAVSYGLRYHQHLGFTHSVGLTLTLEEMRIEPISYGDIFAGMRGIRNTVKKDINACSHDELASLPGIGERHAARIMRYRLTVGPVSRAALLQIGITEPELNRLTPLITGLAPDDDANDRGRAGRHRAEKAQKELFGRLIAIGLPPSTALTAAEMSLSGDRRLSAVINGVPGLDPEKKKKALEACGLPR